MESDKIKLTPAQKREYNLLQKYGSIYVAGYQRRRVFEALKEKGLCYSIDWYWFHILKKDFDN